MRAVDLYEGILHGNYGCVSRWCINRYYTEALNWCLGQVPVCFILWV
jgi:hypothetical protein